MRLILMRHAKAMKRDHRVYPDDSQRPLSEKGKKEHRWISRVIFEMGVTFDRILTSPYERAVETARITADVYGYDKELVHVDQLGGQYSPRGILDRLRRCEESETILLVGHEPDMSSLANTLLGPEASLDMAFKKSGVMAMDFDGMPLRGQGTLEYFLKPRLLRNLSKKKGLDG